MGGVLSTPAHVTLRRLRLPSPYRVRHRVLVPGASTARRGIELDAEILQDTAGHDIDVGEVRDAGRGEDFPVLFALPARVTGLFAGCWRATSYHISLARGTNVAPPIRSQLFRPGRGMV